MQKSFNIIVINIIVLLILLVSLNYFVEKKLVENNSIILRSVRDKIWNLRTKNYEIDVSKYNIENGIAKKIEFTYETFNKFCGEEREEFGFEKNYNKRPIIVTGCSYAYGHGLKKEESFSALLSDLTQRPIINFAACGGEILSSYNNLIKYIEKSEENRKKIYNAEYVVYIYMSDHLNRYLGLDYKNYMYSNYEDIFKISKFEKYLLKVPIGRYFLTSMKIYYILKDYPDSDKASKYLKQIISGTYKKIKNYAPNTKMIIIIYDERMQNCGKDDVTKFLLDPMNSKIWEELQNEDEITVIHTKDLTGIVFDKDYKLKEDIDGWHPNAKAWELFTPLFAKEYIK